MFCSWDWIFLTFWKADEARWWNRWCKDVRSSETLADDADSHINMTWLTHKSIYIFFSDLPSETVKTVFGYDSSDSDRRRVWIWDRTLMSGMMRRKRKTISRLTRRIISHSDSTPWAEGSLRSEVSISKTRVSLYVWSERLWSSRCKTWSYTWREPLRFSLIRWTRVGLPPQKHTKGTKLN